MHQKNGDQGAQFRRAAGLSGVSIVENNGTMKGGEPLLLDRPVPELAMEHDALEQRWDGAPCRPWGDNMG